MHFGGLELAPSAGLEAFERQGAVPAAVQVHDAMADGLEHPPDLAVAALVQNELELRTPESAHLGRGSRTVVELDPGPQLLELGIADRALTLDLVHLVELVPRVGDAVRKLAVVREHQRARRGGVEAADRHDSHRMLDELDDRRASLRVAGGRDDSGRLVEEHVRKRLLVQPLAVQAHVVGCLDERVQLSGLAVDGHPAGLDQLVGFPPRCDSGARQPGIQPHPRGC